MDEPYGHEPDGRLIYTPDGDVAVLIVTGEETVGYMGYVEGTDAGVIHNIELGLGAFSKGTKLLRFAKWDGADSLHLSASDPAVPGPVLTMKWHRQQV